MNSLSSVLTSAVVCLLLGGLMTAARRGLPLADSATGNLIFRYSMPFRWIAAILGFGMPILVTLMLISRPPATEGDTRAFFDLYLLSVAISFPLVWESARMHVTARADGLESVSAWLGRKFIRWEDISEVSFSPAMYWFTVRANDGRSFRVSFFIAGISSFLELCEQHLPSAKLEKATSGYGVAGRTFPRGDGKRR